MYQPIIEGHIKSINPKEALPRKQHFSIQTHVLVMGIYL